MLPPPPPFKIIPLLLDLKYLAIKASNNVPSCPDMSMRGEEKTTIMRPQL